MTGARVSLGVSLNGLDSPHFPIWPGESSRYKVSLGESNTALRVRARIRARDRCGGIRLTRLTRLTPDDRRRQTGNEDEGS